MRRLLYPLAGVVLAGLLTPSAHAQFGSAPPPPAELKVGFESITVQDAQAWLGVLAGPEMEGRGSGQPGYLKAAAWMAERFKEFGLKPIGENGTYFQPVPWVEGTISEGTQLQIGDVKADLGTQMVVLSSPSEGRFEGPVVLLQVSGEGSLSTEQMQELSGKFVITRLRNVPNSLRRQINASGALGVFEISENLPERRQFRSFGSLPRLSGRIHPELANKVLEAAQLLPSAMPETGVSLSSASSVSLSVEVKAEIKRMDMPNVVGLLEGSDPELKAEYVGIGAHLDHLGAREVNGQKVVFPGADDDGSGCTALLAVAKALSLNPTKPKRSVLFMAFAGEEVGLVGSTYYVENPLLPLEKMVALLQMDMVGRDAEGIQNNNPNEVEQASQNRDTLRLVGSQKHSTEFHQTILEMNRHLNFQFRYDREDVYTRSDHYVFARVGIPVAFSFVGFHPDYHRPTDTIDKINWLKLTNTAKLKYLVTMQLANRPNRPTLDLWKPGN